MYGEKRGCLSKKNGKKASRIAWGGVGKPIKLSAWRVSLLNLASLSMENTAIRNAAKFNQELTLGTWGVCKNSSYRMAAGKTPKLTMSASESRSLPIPENDCNTRDANPSKKSKIAARNRA